MAILIVDRDPRTRHAIRTMLKRAYSGVMIETKDFTEAARVLEQNKTKIQYVIASLLKENQSDSAVFAKVKNLEAFDTIPTIGLVSHSILFFPKTYSKIRFRIDSYLKRPFSAESLHHALKVASINRLQSRHLLGFWGDPNHQSTQQLKNLVQTEKYFFKDVEVFSNPHDLQNQPQSVLGKLCALVVDPVFFNSNGGFGNFKKTPAGQKTSIICLGKDPKKVGTLRDQADLFLPFDEFKEHSQLEMIENFIMSRWELDHNLQLMKQTPESREETNLGISKRLIKHAPFYVHGYLQYADHLEALNKLDLARNEYQRAIHINPFAPRAYLKLIRILEKQGGSPAEISNWISQAHEHCPAHPEIQQLHQTSTQP